MVKTGMQGLRIALLGLCLLGLGACATDPAEVRQRFDEGLKAYDSGDFSTAYTVWDGIRDADLAALRNVAMMTRVGKGVKKDPETALKLMAAVAETDLPVFAVVAAKADLGDMYLTGEAGKKDVEKAVFWLTEAAGSGHPVAAYRLAGLYETGTDVPRDLVLAQKYYKIAADVGYADAADKLKTLPPP